MARLIPLIVLLSIVTAAAFFIYCYKFMPRAIGRLQQGAVELGSRDPGYVKAIHVKPGQRVVKGQFLAELDSDALRAQCKAAAARLEKASRDLEALCADLNFKQELTRLQVEDTFAQTKIQLAEAIAQCGRDTATFESAKAQLSGAELELARVSKLTSSGAATQKQLDNQTATVNSFLKEVEWYEKVVEADKRDIADVKRRVDTYGARQPRVNVPIDAQLLPAQAEVESAKADLEVAGALLNYKILKAQFDGTILSILKRPGDVLGIATPVLSMCVFDKRRVEAYVQEQWCGHLEKGLLVKLMPATAHLFGSVKGRIVEVDSTISEIPQDFMEPYDKRSLHGMHFIIELTSEWSGPAGVRFDITF